MGEDIVSRLRGGRAYTNSKVKLAEIETAESGVGIQFVFPTILTVLFLSKPNAITAIAAVKEHQGKQQTDEQSEITFFTVNIWLLCV